MIFDGIIVAGGAAERLGGRHKPGLRIGTRRLLDIAIDALAGAQRIVVVGPRLLTETDVEWAREEPPGGGPVAAIATAINRCDAATVVVLAADLPFVTAAAVSTLRASCDTAVASMAVDDHSRDQPLLACYDLERLREAIPTPARGASMRAVTTTLSSLGSINRVDLGGDPPVTWDCDTAVDLVRAREHA